MRYLVMHFEAPLMSFGAPAVGEIRPTEIWPSLSMVTGIVANALGYQAYERERLQHLQNIICFGTRIESLGYTLIDFQTAQLSKKEDLLWRSDGTGPDERAGGDFTYSAPTLRYKHYLNGFIISLVLSLSPEENGLTINNVAKALYYPERPLFIGRACCIPSGPLFRGEWIEAETIPDALASLKTNGGVGNEKLNAEWPERSGTTFPFILNSRKVRRTDMRDWINDMHAGERIVFRGEIRRKERIS